MAQAPARPLWRLELVTAAERARLAWGRRAVRPVRPRRRRRGLGGIAVAGAGVGAAGGGGGGSGDGERLSYRRRCGRGRGGWRARLRGSGRRAGAGWSGCAWSAAVDAVVAVVAAWRAGGGYVALDPAYPDARLRYLIADSGAGLVLSRGAAARRLETLLASSGRPPRDPARACSISTPAIPTCPERAALPSPPTMPAAPAAHPLDGPSHPQNLAYLIYTSGSTGQPKPVAVSHGGLSNLARQQIAGFAVGPGMTGCCCNSALELRRFGIGTGRWR